MKTKIYILGIFIALIMFTVNINANERENNPIRPTVGEIPIQHNLGAMGNTSFNVPIEVPAGRAGMQPSISVVYNSIAGNSILGMGWNLAGLSSISRVNKTIYHDGVTSPVDNDGEEFALDGMRLIKTNTNKYQSEQGNIRIEYIDYKSQFEVSFPNGNVGTYTGKKFQVAYKDSIINCYPIYLLTNMSGRFGTHISYNYDSPSNPLELTSIEYGGGIRFETNGSYPIDHHIKIQFDYESRPDQTFSYIDKVKLENKRRMTSITMFYNQIETKKYIFSYEPKDISFLSQIDCSAGQESLPPLKFNYGENEAEFKFKKTKLKGFKAFIPEKNSNMTSNDITNVVSAKFSNKSGRNGLVVYPKRGETFIYHRDEFGYEPASISNYQSGYTDKDTIYIYEDVLKNEPPKKILAKGMTQLFVLDIDGSGIESIVKVEYRQHERVINPSNKTNMYFTVYNHKGEKIRSVNLFNGPNFLYKVGSILGIGYAYKTVPLPHIFIPGDFNGDGKIEMWAYSIHFQKPRQKPGRPEYLPIEGALIDFSNETVIKRQGDLTSIYNSDNYFAIDHNGDGKSEIFQCSSHSYPAVNLNGGTSEVNQMINPVEKIIIRTNDKIDGTEKKLIGDINGDGKTDYLITPPIHTDSIRWVLASSKGEAKKNKIVNTSSSNARPPSTTNNRNYSSFEIKYFDFIPQFEGCNYLLQDMDGDGLVDLVVQNNTQILVYINKNGSFNASDKYEININANPVLAATNVWDNNKSNLLAGVIDEYYVTIQNEYNLSRERMLHEVTNSMGVVDKISYKDSYDTTVHTVLENKVFPYSPLPQNIHLTSAVSRYVNDAKVNSILYKYEGATIHRQGLGFNGFDKVITIDSARNNSVVSTFDPMNYGVMKRVDSPSGFSTFDYDISIASDKIAKVTLKEKVEKDKIKNITVASSFSYDEYGNKTSEIVDFGNGLKSETKNEYFNYTRDFYRLGDLGAQSIKSITPNGIVNTSLVIPYNQNNYLPDSKKSYYNDELVAVEYFFYDSYGRVTESKSRTYTSPNLFITKNTYDTFGRIVKKIDPLGLHTEYVYNTKGQLETVKNHKGHETKYIYDVWGRNVETIYPDNAIATTRLEWVSSPKGAKTVSTTTATGQPTTKVYLDALGREIRKGQLRFDGKYMYTDTEYDDWGRVKRTSLPYKGTAASLWNSCEYDKYDRIVSLNYASGKKDTYEYKDNTITSVIDNVSTTKSFDATGKLKSVSNPAGTIVYNYRADGQASSIIAPGEIITSFEYDKYGRQTKIIDPSAGTRSFGYDDAGNINKETDANNKVTKMVYDRYNRLTQKEVVGELTTTYTYNADGLSSSQSSTNGTSKSITYDDLLRPEIEKETVVDGKWLQKKYSYSNGNIESVAFSSNSGNIATENYYYEKGYLAEIKLNNSTSIWKLTKENDLGIATEALTGSLIRSYKFDAYGMPTERSARTATATVQSFAYDFNHKNGNLNWRMDNTRPNLGKESFGYDNLNRLTTFGGNTISYNKIGNITEHTGVGVFKYSEKKPYAIEFVAQSDSVIPMRKQDIIYNGMLRPTSIIENDYVATFAYNSAADRVKMHLMKNGAAELTRYYLGGQYEIDEGVAGTKERLYLGGDAYSAAAVLVKENGSWNVFYILRDYLGSITHITDASGIVKQELSYDAWGRLRNPGTHKLYAENEQPTLMLARGYTGHEHLTMFGLINMNARLYDPAVGRFLSPDPYVQAPDFSQNFNRYSYCWNNPLKYTDLSGEYVGVDDLIAALVGGVINVVSNAVSGNIDSWGEGFSYFGVGALAGWASLYATPIAGAAIMAGGNDIVNQSFAVGFTNIEWGQVGINTVVGTAIGAITMGASSAVTPYVSSMTSSIASPVLREGLTHGVTGAVVGGGVGMAVASNSGATGKDLWKSAGKSAAMGFAMGTISGTTAGLRQAHKDGVNPLTGNDKQTYEIGDGVRRAKALQMQGAKKIQVELNDGTVKEVPIKNLRSPMKSELDLSRSQELNRFNNLYNDILKNGQKTPIYVTPGNRGVPVNSIKLKY